MTIAAGLSAGVASSDNHSQRWIVATKINRGVAALCSQGSGGCPLRGLGFLIEDVGFHEHLSPGFMVGASFTESSGGSSPCCGSSYDIWGWYAMGGASSWHDAFTKYARFIHARWPGARTPWDLNGYCGCGTTAWGNATSRWMARMGFGGGRLAYP